MLRKRAVGNLISSHRHHTAAYKDVLSLETRGHFIMGRGALDLVEFGIKGQGTIEKQGSMR